MLEISKTSKTIVVIVITFIITVYFNVLVVQTGYDNEIPIYHHDKISDFLQSVLFCFGAIPFIVFVIIYYLYTLFFELCNSKERIFLISIINCSCVVINSLMSGVCFTSFIVSDSGRIGS